MGKEEQDTSIKELRESVDSMRMEIDFLAEGLIVICDRLDKLIDEQIPTAQEQYEIYRQALQTKHFDKELQEHFQHHIDKKEKVYNKYKE